MITPESLAKSGTEHGHQAAIFCFAANNFDKYPQLRYLFAIPNGGFRNKATAGRLKAEGVKSGVPDIFLAWPHKGYHGLFIELKVGRNTPSDEQEKWLDALTSAGYYSIWCTGWEAAISNILCYIQE